MSGETAAFGGLVDTITEGLSMSKLWGTIAPLGGVIVFSVLFALARRVFNKNTNAISKAKAGKV